MKVAVVGAGISGLAAAYELSKAGANMVLYEKEEHLGGHAKPVSFDGVDLHLGFMVFNRVTYPNMMEFFEGLDVEMEISDMSFSVSLEGGNGVEWGSRNGLSSLFAQKSNAVNPYFWQMIREIVKFKEDVLKYLEEHETNLDMDRNETLEQFIKSHGYSQLFQKAYVVPICASLWSCPSEGVMKFSAFSVLSFCRNHHLLQLFGRPQWLTVKSHSHCYVNKVIEELENMSCQIKTSCAVTSISSINGGCRVTAIDGTDEMYDGCLIAAHAPDALNMLGTEATYEESRILGAFQYVYSLEGFSSLDGLESLSKLINLSLEGLERVSDRNIAERANLRSKNQLLELTLSYTSLSSEEQLSETDEKKKSTEDVLNELCPPRSLKMVSINGYFGRCLPIWLNLGAATLPNLRYIEIYECACFEVLPMLGQLPNLHTLHIKGAYSVERVGEEFMQGDTKSRDPIVHTITGSVRPAFPKLNELMFLEMPNWKDWQWNKGQPAMPKLKKLFIQACPQLRSLPEGLLLYATSLEFLQIHGADKLITVENISSIKDIRVIGNPNLVRISNFPSISNILIANCPNLKVVMNPKALQTMRLGDRKMKVLPDYLTTTMSRKLIIHCDEELLLKIANQGESGSEWHKFKHISKVKIGTWDKSLHATYQKTPFSFTTNVNASRDEA